MPVVSAIIGLLLAFLKATPALRDVFIRVSDEFSTRAKEQREIEAQQREERKMSESRDAIAKARADAVLAADLARMRDTTSPIGERQEIDSKTGLPIGGSISPGVGSGSTGHDRPVGT